MYAIRSYYVAVGAAPPPPGKPVLFAHPEKAAGLMPTPEIAATNSAAFRSYGGPALVDEAVRVLEAAGRLRRVQPAEADAVISAAGTGLEAVRPDAAVLIVPSLGGNWLATPSRSGSRRWVTHWAVKTGHGRPPAM